MSNGPLVEVLSAADLEGRIPTARNVILDHEFDPEKSRLLLIANAGDDLLAFNMSGAENYLTAFVLNDVAGQVPELGFDYYRPSLDLYGRTAIEWFEKTPTPLGAAVRHETDRGTLDVYRYTAQSNRRSTFVRDIIFGAHTHPGKENYEILVSSPVSDRDPTGYALALALNRDLQVPIRRIPADLANGNVIVSDSFIFTLQDTLHKNKVADQDPAPVLKFLKTPNGMINFGRDIAVLDFGTLAEGKQRIFHIDLLLNVVRAPDGSEYFLLASPLLAQLLLQEQGYLNGTPLNMGIWKDRMGYPMYGKKQILKTSHMLIKTLAQQPESKILASQIEDLALRFSRIVGLPGYAHEDIGKNLDQFFWQSNMVPLQEYVDIIRSALLALGIPNERIIDIPSLLFHDGYHETNMREDKQKMIGQRSIPIFAPVNGVQMRSSSLQKDVFLTVGGIRLFDDYISQALASIGIQHIPLPSGIALGYSSSGFRCVFVPR